MTTPPPSLTPPRFGRRALCAGAAAALTPLPAFASPEAAQRWLRERASSEAREGRVAIAINDVVENGTQVPLTVTVESPMTEASHCRALHIAADANPNPGIASFAFGPGLGRCEIGLRIRLAQSGRITALAEMSDGTLWRAERRVTVTLGGCAG